MCEIEFKNGKISFYCFSLNKLITNRIHNMKIKGLTVIFVITFLITFWINFIDFKLSTFWIFTNKATKAETIIDNLCLSYIAGYIFYFINVYLVERSEKRHILPYVADKVQSIVINNLHIVTVLTQDKKKNKYFPDRNEFLALLSFENLTTIKIYNYEKKDFITYLNIRAEGTIKNIDKILNSGKYVDDELKAILFKLKESMLLNSDYCLNQSTYDAKNFNRYNGVFNTYFKDIQKLSEFYDKNLKSYYWLNHKGKFFKKYDIVSIE